MEEKEDELKDKNEGMEERGGGRGGSGGRRKEKEEEEGRTE